MNMVFCTIAFLYTKDVRLLLARVYLSSTDRMLVSIILIVLAAIFIVDVILKIINVKGECFYIRSEIERANTKKDKKRWKRRLRRTILAQIPLIGFIYKEKN